MKLKRYTAASMREALAMIRAEQGEEAVILSTRRLEAGVEVVSAVDYDATLIGQAPSPQRAPVAPVSEAATERPPAAAEPAVAVAEPPRLEVRDLGYARLQRELEGLRHLLEHELAAMGWKTRREANPFQARVLDELLALDLAPDVAQRLARLLPRRTDAKVPEHIPMALLMKHLPMVTDDVCVEGGVVAVVGPTGVGKTTTIAKLATRWCLRHGNQDLALVSTDGYRIGARDQLLTYARILDVPMYTAEGGGQLGQVLGRLKDKRLVLVDTAGMSQRDVRIPSQLESLRLGLGRARVLLAVPAGGELRALGEIIAAYSRVAPHACVLTKIDEAASLGGSLSVTLRSSLPIAWLCNGQRVPEDLHAAEPKRVWLLRAALSLKEKAGPHDGASMVRKFPQVQAHA